MSGTDEIPKLEIPAAVRRRRLLTFGALFTGFSAISSLKFHDSNDSSEANPSAAATGVATLDSNRKVPLGQLPDLSSMFVSATVLSGPGIDPTGRADSAAAIQRKIDAVRDAVRETGLATNNVLVLPGGHYQIEKTIVQPPYVHIVIQGTAIVEWKGGNGTCWHITPLPDDPANLYAPLEKNQWNNHTLIDGNLILHNTSTSDGTSVGLELGSRSDLGAGRLLKGYSIRGVSIQRFDTLKKMNTYNHYLGRFENCLFEVAGGYNATVTGACLRVGDPENGNFNSGENFEYAHCIFASAKQAIVVDAPGWDLSFNNCSFDYLATVAKLNKGYGRLAFQGGHIEAINVEQTETNGVLVSEVAEGTSNVNFDATTMLVQPRSAIRGRNLVVTGSAYLRPAGDNNTAFPGSFLVTEEVTACTLKNLEISNRRIVSAMDNRLVDPYFEDEEIGVLQVGASLVNWEISNWGVSTVEVSSEGLSGGGRSVKVVLLAGSSVVFQAKDVVPLRSGWERSGTICLRADFEGVRASVSAIYLRGNGQEFSPEEEVSLLAEHLPAGSWRMPSVMQQVAPHSNHAARAVSVKPIFAISNPTNRTISAYIGYLYFGE
ncbi:glycosyl hydrolase family 28-related protein [Arthrobacter sp. P2b]|uniref:glycosyl hydrolase family 28-related protein n=1 Tax=Arthrobacter sp. P2b TaxID=1938741 RepID=UPI0009CA2401|nr:glycosyl hydrolase family 28-related protein [Arthrobacter sp. P2b]SLJ99978.1 Pectate lyase superfamily protein [Arthrobacter sp. P2b]